MNKMSSAEIRQAFLYYFKQQGHKVLPSSSLIPANDPTLMFTNAGMVQFKDVFLGNDQRPYQRAVTSQRCVRAGGKHNDLENVGYTARHHTFFEMLGNFSFGDYFKADAIKFAWSFLTEVLGLPKERLWVTVHYTDDEAERIWKQDIGVDPDKFSKLDEDNFWSMGDTGPCGPCSEIFFDHGSEVAGGPPGSPDEDGDRYIEIWNLVFMQYNRTADGKTTPLPKPSVDTGMGLERIAAVLQGVHSNYEIDLFKNLLQAVGELIPDATQENQSARVIADHIRSCVFLVVDGVLPSNEGAGYVLRRIIRRALRHGNKLGATEPFFYKLVAALVAEMGVAYPELVEKQSQVERVLLQEEQRFADTLEHGMKLLQDEIEQLDTKVIKGELAFKLYDTYGFPLDLTADVAREQGLTIDNAGFEQAMEAQRARARAAGQFKVDYNEGLAVEGATVFSGYELLEDSGEVIALFVKGQPVEQLEANDTGVVVLDTTPFYAESGGQIGDRGEIYTATASFQVLDCVKEAKTFIHQGVLKRGTLRLGDKVQTKVDPKHRQATTLNHSGTHLLHAALKQALGEHVQQKGSLNDTDRLRFDFSHFEAMTPEQLAVTEQQVNEHIRLNTPVITEIMPLEVAKAKGAAALFGEKYDADVRVVSMGGDFSMELCGGTHVKHTGEIGLFKIVSESGIAAGVRRIEAVTAEGAMVWLAKLEAALAQVSAEVKATADTVVDKVQSLVERNRQLEKNLKQLEHKLATAAGQDLLTQAVEVKGVQVLAAQLEGIEAKALRDTVDQLKNKLGTAVVVLATVQDGRIALAAGVTADLTAKVQAGNLVKTITGYIGGKGGGRPDFAQGGGVDVAALPDALTSTLSLVETAMEQA